MRGMQSVLRCANPGTNAGSDHYGDPLAMAGLGAWSCDLQTDTISWTTEVFDMFGFPPHEPIDRRDTVDLYTEPSRMLLERLRPAAIASAGRFSMEAQIIRPDSDERWIRIKAATRVRHGKAVTLYGLKEDITAERRRWDQLRRLSEYDALTGLGNRALYHTHFLNHAPGSEGLAGVNTLTLLRLDNLREINDRWGIAAGDACLVAFARRILTACSPETFGARLGGRQFAVLLNLDGQARVHGAATLPPGLEDPVLWRGSAIPLHVSVGMAFLARQRKFEPEALHARAVLALEMARQKSRIPLRVVALAFNDGPRRGIDVSAAPEALANLAHCRLSSREAEALNLMARGFTIDKIAQSMAVSRHTVRNFIRRIYLKMGVGSRAEAVRLGILQGLL